MKMEFEIKKTDNKDFPYGILINGKMCGWYTDEGYAIAKKYAEEWGERESRNFFDNLEFKGINYESIIS